MQLEFSFPYCQTGDGLTLLVGIKKQKNLKLAFYF